MLQPDYANNPVLPGGVRSWLGLGMGKFLAPLWNFRNTYSHNFVVKWHFENRLQWSRQLRAHLPQVWNDFDHITIDSKELSHFSFFQTYFDVVAASGSAGSITGPCLGTLPSVRMHFCLCCLSYKWKKLDQMTNTLNHINITLNNPPVEVRWHPVLHSFQQGLLNTLGIQYSHTWLIQQACMIGNS